MQCTILYYEYVLFLMAGAKIGDGAADADADAIAVAVVADDEIRIWFLEKIYLNVKPKISDTVTDACLGMVWTWTLRKTYGYLNI